MFMFWLCVVIIFLCVVYMFVFKHNRRKYPQPPAYPGWIPLIGHAYLFIGDSFRIWKSLQKIGQECLRRGGVITVSLGLETFYVLADPFDYPTVGNTCLEKDKRYKLLKPWLGDGLITGSVDIWKKHRKLLNPAFNPIVLEGFLQMFNSQSKQLVKKLASKLNTGPFDQAPYFEKLTLETVCFTAIGVPENDSVHWVNQYIQAANQLAKIQMYKMVKIWLQIPLLFYLSGLKKEEDSLIEAVHGFMDQIIKAKRSTLHQNILIDTKDVSGSRFKAFLDLMLEYSQNSEAFSDKEIREEVDCIVLAGYQGLASTLTFILVMIGSYKNVQNRLHQELEEIYGNSDRDVDKTDMPKLMYLEAVIKETLRLYTVTPVISRHLHKNVKLKNYTLLEGRSCVLMIYGLHHHPMWGPDVHDFKPERWLDSSKLLDANKLFFPFSFGRRDCIGKVYSMMLMKTVLVQILRRYRINADHTKLDLKLNIILKPERGHFISIEDRKKN